MEGGVERGRGREAVKEGGGERMTEAKRGMDRGEGWRRREEERGMERCRRRREEEKRGMRKREMKGERCLDVVMVSFNVMTTIKIVSFIFRASESESVQKSSTNHRRR
ncbi:hypothetical protein NQD34_010115 [Periophthalmus magnuspinnatus]|nr:hypothetical protein NQD34_010115 [Periophthalmus magnuspinnatus]